MIIDCFTTAEVSRISGFSVRQLDYWARSGILMPGVQQSNGPGTRKLYNFDDLVKARFMQQLRQAGWSTQKIRKGLEHLRKFTEGLPSHQNISLLHDKKTILALCENAEGQRILLDVLNPGGQQVLWIVLDILRDETRQKAEQDINLHSVDKKALEFAV